MNQLTIRGFDKDLEQYIVRLARGEGISLNRAVLKLLRRGAGIGDDANARDTVGTSLDHLIGTWTADELNEMEQALGDLSHIDESMWSENPVGFQCLLALETRRAACERAPDSNEAVMSAADLLPEDVDDDPRDTSFLARWAEM